jgi:acetate kinase
VIILVINSGSSSIKFSVFAAEPATPANGNPAISGDPRCLFDGELSGIGEAAPTFEIRDANGASVSTPQPDRKAQSPEDATRFIFKAIGRLPMARPDAVGYRVVHPGPKLNDHQLITDQVLEVLDAAAAFAPLHDPIGVRVIRQGMAQFPDVAHYACFDTVFHKTMPVEATTYPIPLSLREQGVHRYGFHGLSCESIVRRMRAAGASLPRRMVIAHLGSGCSVTALVDGCSVDTTMGLTPTGGVVMGTRPGDLDPGLILYMLRQHQGNPASAISAVETMLNHECGIVALAELPNDVRAVRTAAANGDDRSRLALKVFTRSITKAIGGFCWILGGLDAIVFAGGIGEHDALTRAETLSGLQSLGICVDDLLNQTRSDHPRKISSPESRSAVFVVPAQEDAMIALHVLSMAAE